MKSLALSLATLLTAATPALADTCTTQTPPSPLSSMAPSSPCNSLPPRTGTSQFRTFGGALTVTRFGPAVGSMPWARTRPLTATARSAPVQTGSD